MSDSKYRKYFEQLLDEVHSQGYKLTTDKDNGEKRIVIFEKYQIIYTLIRSQHRISFDIYANLSKGIYEIGDLHLLTRKMLELKKISLKYNAVEMNTTERLYPQDRTGESTTTSGL